MHIISCCFAGGIKRTEQCYIINTQPLTCSNLRNSVKEELFYFYGVKDFFHSKYKLIPVFFKLISCCQSLPGVIFQSMSCNTRPDIFGNSQGVLHQGLRRIFGLFRCNITMHNRLDCLLSQQKFKGQLESAYLKSIQDDCIKLKFILLIFILLDPLWRMQ